MLDKSIQKYQLQNNIIYEGTAVVKNGIFNLTFIAPKDINYNYGLGKISMYAIDSSGTDASGSFSDIVVGGVNSEYNINDVSGPEIKLYMNDESFISGGLTNTNPSLLVRLSDLSGINTSTSGIGHEITAVLNDSKESIVLNGFYNPTPQKKNEGVISYPFYDLAPGNYSISVKAWDIFNNSSTSSIEFVVTDNPSLEVASVVTYPNPFSESTTFAFNHNRSGNDLKIELQIFNLSGIMVKNFTEIFPSSPGHLSFFEWSGNDNSEMPLPPGIFMYKLNIYDMSAQTQSTSYGKVVLSR